MKDLSGEASSPRNPLAPKPWEIVVGPARPQDLLARIVPDDPLGIGDRVSRRLREQARLVDRDQVALRAFALLARELAQETRGGSIEPLLRRVVDRALDEVLEEEARLALLEPNTARGPKGEEHKKTEPARAFVEIARPLGLDATDLRRACVRFNDLPLEVREAFFRVVLEAQPISSDSSVEVGRARLVQRARLALEVLGSTADAHPSGLEEAVR